MVRDWVGFQKLPSHQINIDKKSLLIVANNTNKKNSLNNVISWIKEPRNYIFLIVLTISFIITLRKYDFIDLLKVCIFSLVFGLIIRLIFFRR